VGGEASEMPSRSLHSVDASGHVTAAVAAAPLASSSLLRMNLDSEATAAAAAASLMVIMPIVISLSSPLRRQPPLQPRKIFTTLFSTALPALHRAFLSFSLQCLQQPTHPNHPLQLNNFNAGCEQPKSHQSPSRRPRRRGFRSSDTGSLLSITK
jgi:hypothetical protein